MKTLSSLLLALLATSTIVACGSSKPKVQEPESPEVVAEPEPEPEPPPPPTPFEKLGQRQGIVNIVDSFLKNAGADPRVSKLFAKFKGDKLESLKMNLADHLCKGVGGDCTAEAPAGNPVKITDAQFDFLVEDLQLALSEFEADEANSALVKEQFTALRNELAILLNPKK